MHCHTCGSPLSHSYAREDGKDFCSRTCYEIHICKRAKARFGKPDNTYELVKKGDAHYIKKIEEEL